LLTRLSRILTGAGSGIGLSIVNLLLSDPHVALVVAVDLITAPLVPVRSQHGDRIELIQGDVSERSTSEAAISTALSKLGRIDAIILNAAVLGPISSIADGDVVEWKRLFDVNFFSLLHTVCTLQTLNTISASL
jgi:NAD(P)-dependent dehydrogenase (short-subunit alcohol dehydrogenase family)